MHLESYQSSYKEEVSLLLHLYFSEAHGKDYIGSSGDCYFAIDDIVNSGRAIYVLFDDDIMIGMLITYINDQFSLVKPTIVGEYMYLIPDYRGSKATMYLYAMLGKISEQYGYDVIGTTLCNSSSNHNSKYNDHEPIAITYLAKHDTVVKNYQRYKNKLKLL